MAKDKNGEKRLEYNRQILDAEYAYDELQDQKRSVFRNLENLENALTQSFQNLRRIDEELHSRSHAAAGDFYDENQQKYRYVTQMISNQREETEMQYRQALQENEEAKEQLQRERDNLAWE